MPNQEQYTSQTYLSSDDNDDLIDLNFDSRQSRFIGRRTGEHYKPQQLIQRDGFLDFKDLDEEQQEAQRTKKRLKRFLENRERKKKGLPPLEDSDKKIPIARQKQKKNIVQKQKQLRKINIVKENKQSNKLKDYNRLSTYSINRLTFGADDIPVYETSDEQQPQKNQKQNDDVQIVQRYQISEKKGDDKITDRRKSNSNIFYASGDKRSEKKKNEVEEQREKMQIDPPQLSNNINKAIQNKNKSQSIKQIPSHFLPKQHLSEIMPNNFEQDERLMNHQQDFQHLSSIKRGNNANTSSPKSSQKSDIKETLRALSIKKSDKLQYQTLNTDEEDKLNQANIVGESRVSMEFNVSKRQSQKQEREKQPQKIKEKSVKPNERDIRNPKKLKFNNGAKNNSSKSIQIDDYTPFLTESITKDNAKYYQQQSKAKRKQMEEMQEIRKAQEAKFNEDRKRNRSLYQEQEDKIFVQNYLQKTQKLRLSDKQTEQRSSLEKQKENRRLSDKQRQRKLELEREIRQHQLERQRKRKAAIQKEKIEKQIKEKEQNLKVKQKELKEKQKQKNKNKSVPNENVKKQNKKNNQKFQKKKQDPKKANKNNKKIHANEPKYQIRKNNYDEQALDSFQTNTQTAYFQEVQIQKQSSQKKIQQQIKNKRIVTQVDKAKPKKKRPIRVSPQKIKTSLKSAQKVHVTKSYELQKLLRNPKSYDKIESLTSIFNQQNSAPTGRPQRHRQPPVQYWKGEKIVYDSSRTAIKHKQTQILKIAGFIQKSFRGQLVTSQPKKDNKGLIIQKITLQGDQVIDFKGYPPTFQELIIKVDRLNSRKIPNIEVYYMNDIRTLEVPLQIDHSESFTIQNMGKEPISICFQLKKGRQEYNPKRN